MFTYVKKSLFFKLVCLSTAWIFVFSTFLMPIQAYAQGSAGILNLPVPGTMVNLSPVFEPALIKGLNVYPDNPLKFDFIIDRGDSNLSEEKFKQESTKLIKYFLASLTVPESEMWVNLSPYEKDRIIPESFGQTEMGRDLLAQDYMLKQLSSSLIHPDKKLGKEFWSRVYKKAYEKFGTIEIPLNTFNKIWIVPVEAFVYEHSKGALVVRSHLKVMLEEDYTALQKHIEGNLQGIGDGVQGIETTKPYTLDPTPPAVSSVTTNVVREVLIPEIEKEVNEGATFANLRQVYHAVILATWFKQALKESLLGQIYVDKNKTAGVKMDDAGATGQSPVQYIYDQYIEAYKKGVYDFIKEDVDPGTKELIPRKYFSGGATVKGTEALVDGRVGKGSLGNTDEAQGLKGQPEDVQSAVVEAAQGITEGEIVTVEIAGADGKPLPKGPGEVQPEDRVVDDTGEEGEDVQRLSAGEGRLTIDAKALKVNQDLVRKIMVHLRSKGTLGNIDDLVESIASRVIMTKQCTMGGCVVGQPVAMSHSEKVEAIKDKILRFINSSYGRIDDVLFEYLEKRFGSGYEQEYLGVLLGEPLQALFKEEAQRAEFTTIVLEEPLNPPGVVSVEIYKSKQTGLKFKAREGTLIVYTQFAQQLTRVYEAELDKDKPQTRALLQTLMNIEKSRIKIVNQRIAPGLLAKYEATTPAQTEERARYRKLLASLSYTQVAGSMSSGFNTETFLDNMALFIWFSYFYTQPVYDQVSPIKYLDLKAKVEEIVDSIITGAEGEVPIPWLGGEAKNELIARILRLDQLIDPNNKWPEEIERIHAAEGQEPPVPPEVPPAAPIAQRPAVDTKLEMDKHRLRQLLQYKKSRGELDINSLARDFAGSLTITEGPLFGAGRRRELSESEKISSLTRSITNFVEYDAGLDETLLNMLLGRFDTSYNSGFLLRVVLGDELEGIVLEEASKSGFENVTVEDVSPEQKLAGITMTRSKQTGLQWKAQDKQLVLYLRSAERLKEVYDGEVAEGKPNTRALVRTIMRIQRERIAVVNERKSPLIMDSYDLSTPPDKDIRQGLAKKLARASYKEFVGGRDEALNDLALVVWYNEIFYHSDYRRFNRRDITRLREEAARIVSEVSEGYEGVQSWLNEKQQEALRDRVIHVDQLLDPYDLWPEDVERVSAREGGSEGKTPFDQLQDNVGQFQFDQASKLRTSTMRENLNEIAAAKEIDFADVEKERSERFAKQGGFDKRIFFEAVYASDDTTEPEQAPRKLVRDFIEGVIANIRLQGKLVAERRLNDREFKEALVAKLKEELGYLTKVIDGEDKKKIAHELAAVLEVLNAIDKMAAVGGIDFNPALGAMNIERDGEGVELPVSPQFFENIQLEGVLPVIINITPIHNNLMLLLGLAEETEEASEPRLSRLPS